MMMANSIRVVGARVHNLKNITVEIPRDKFVVITGLVRLGQIVAGFRHDLRRGTAPLCRVIISVCPSIHWADGQTRCGSHRGPLPRRFH